MTCGQVITVVTGQARLAARPALQPFKEQGPHVATMIFERCSAMQPLGAPSILLSPVATEDHGPKIVRFGPDGNLYYSVGPSCDRTGACQCGAPVSSSPLVQYCSIAQMAADGSHPQSKITGKLLTFSPDVCA